MTIVLIGAKRTWAPLALIALSLIIADATRTAASDSPSSLSPEELHFYDKAHSVIDWTPKEVRARKELKGLRPAESQQDLSATLQEVGKHVAAFFMSFPNISAKESIQWIVDHETTQSSAKGDFRYFLVRGPMLGGENVQEYRTDPDGKAIDYNNLQYAPLLTSRFTASLLYFDPHNQAACRYRYFGTQMLDEKETDVIGFAQIPEANLYLANFSDNQRMVLLLFQGLVWIDHATHHILRIDTELLAPPPRSNLQREITRIDFAAVKVPLIDMVVDLPSHVTVDVWLKMDELLNLKTRIGTSTHRTIGDAPEAYVQHSRNIHNYTDYALYLGTVGAGATP